MIICPHLSPGTMGPNESPSNVLKHQGSLYRLDGAECTPLAEKISIANGLAWDLKEKAFYYIDSHERCIRRYDYDVETGNICEYIYKLAKQSM